MTDYISREEARELMYHNQDALTEYDLNSIPAADVRPVVRSRWELLANGDGICQNCGCIEKHIWDLDGWQNFCGHCGADMRDGGDADERQ